MALIICPECGKKFSDRAVACPECGCPTSEIIGQNSNINDGQMSIANIAFEDGRYEEAYQMFSQLYSQNQSDLQVIVRLGLAAAAKDYFDNGVPNSTKELFAKAFELAKNNTSSHNDFVSIIIPFVNDAKKIITDTKKKIDDELSTELSKVAPMRSGERQISELLFAPMDIAQRNHYEDERTRKNNEKIIQNAKANHKAIIATLDIFGSFVFNLVVDMIEEPLNNSELYALLADFVTNGEEAKIYESMSTTSSPSSNIFGLCYGEEKTILEYKNVICYATINNEKRVKSGLFSTPEGTLVLTNYRVIYNARNSKYSFEESLKDLISVSLTNGGYYIGLTFANNLQVHFTTNPASAKREPIVDTIKEIFKMN